MLEYFILLALTLLIVTHGFLVKGCFRLHSIIPESSNHVASEASNISKMLDELADIINDVSLALPESKSISHAPSLPEILLNALMAKTGMPNEHGSKKPQEWEVLQDHPTPTLETENQPNELSD
jgi:hypothetical protein